MLGLSKFKLCLISILYFGSWITSAVLLDKYYTGGFTAWLPLFVFSFIGLCLWLQVQFEKAESQRRKMETRLLEEINKKGATH